MGDTNGFVGIDADQARWVATRLRAAADYIDSVTKMCDRVDSHALAADLTGPARLRSAETIEELTATASVLDLKADLIEAAGSGRSPRSIDQLMTQLDAELGMLDRSLADTVGPGAGDDRRRFIEELAFPDGVPTPPFFAFDNGEIWTAAMVTAVVLDNIDPELVDDYWRLLGDDERFAVIQVKPGSVSDHVLSGRLVLDEVEELALVVQPLVVLPPPYLSRLPTSGAGTDWLGQRVPTTAGLDIDPDTIVRNDPRNEGGGIAFMPDNVVCTAIQAVSIIPSRPDPSVGGAAAFGVTVASTAWTATRAGATPVKLVSPASWIATAADLGLCRFEMGSGAPISTQRVLDDTGTIVYEDSRSPTQPYMDTHGLPLSPDLEIRDKDRWNLEHQGANWQPYPGYPAFPENAPDS